MDFLVLAVLLVSILVARRYLYAQLVLVAVILLCLARQRARRVAGNRVRMRLLTLHSMDEVLLLECRLAGERCLFMVDTGYAGPCVLSASYLAVGDRHESDLLVRYRNIVRALKTDVTEDRQYRAINAFLASTRCKPYTSGCTMRLMSIGATQEQQADLLLCEALEMRGVSGEMLTPATDTTDARADVFVTHPLPMSVHILTCDYLLHNGPAMLKIADGELHFHMDEAESLRARSRARMHPLRMSGGSFVVEVTIGGLPFRVTVDTGASGGISIANRPELEACRSTTRRIHQVGINGEQLCSQMIAATVRFSGHTFDAFPVLINDAPSDQTDGFMGMGMLRAFDLYVAKDGIGFARNRLSPRSLADYTSLSDGACPKLRLRCRQG